jgi:hypothetical protein
MPNWVDNSLTVTGSEEQVRAFVDQARARYTAKYSDYSTGELKDSEVQCELSFWNFVRPDDSILHEYWGDEPRKASLADALRRDTNHWYDWNVRNWGCKWDAGEVDVPDRSDGYVQYTFQTPWGPPEEFFTAIAEQFPDLTFCLEYTEEQGWGGELTGVDGEVIRTEQWEIPETHADRVERLGYCHCDAWEPQYEDCPKSSEKQLVE